MFCECDWPLRVPRFVFGKPAPPLMTSQHRGEGGGTFIHSLDLKGERERGRGERETEKEGGERESNSNSN